MDQLVNAFSLKVSIYICRISSAQFETYCYYKAFDQSMCPSLRTKSKLEII